MPSIQHILFPFDFSDQSCQAVPYVREMARRFGARVTVYSVVPPSFDPVPAEMGGGHLRAGDDSNEWRLNLQNRLNRALLQEFASLRVERVADSGDAALRIVHFAEGNQVDLIMMPTHGVGAFRAFLIGSVTAKVLHDAACPVWTAAHARTQVAPSTPSSILCAVDGSPSTGPLAHWAVEFANSLNARLTLVHAVGPVSDWPSLERERRLQEEVRDEARGQLAAMLRSAGVSAPLQVVVGTVVPTVAEEAARARADLVFIGRGSLAEPFGRMRTHAYGIIQRSPCPVVSV
jgi:nucleotide-binding universal stress UspA family protein